ncbi:MAG: adenylate kinase [Clostridia bacterium]|nr:adenylate kinase [Clostridia bacterium]
MKELGDKIIVIGSPGSGKSTLAKALKEIVDLPLVHLDNVWWKPDRTHISREEFDIRLAEIIRGDQWIVDGSYSRTLEPRMAACDTVIFLDYSEEVCMASIEARVGEVRTDIPWQENTLDPELVEIVRGYRTNSRPKVFELLARYPDKIVHVFKTRSEAQAWLDGLRQQ